MRQDKQIELLQQENAQLRLDFEKLKKVVDESKDYYLQLQEMSELILDIKSELRDVIRKILAPISHLTEILDLTNEGDKS